MILMMVMVTNSTVHSSPIRKIAPDFALSTELLWRVSKETNLTLTKPPGIACTCAVPGGVKPVLEHAVSELARIAFVAPSVSKRGASDGTVRYPAWVPTLSLLPTVRVRAVRPVVGPGPRAPSDLVREHAELISAVDFPVDCLNRV